MGKNRKLLLFSSLIIALLTAIFFFAANISEIRSFLSYSFYDKDKLNLILTKVNPQVHTLSCDESNILILKVEVRDESGHPVPKAIVDLSIESGGGKLSPEKSKTNNSGYFLAVYTPPGLKPNTENAENTKAVIRAVIHNSSVSSALEVGLTTVPVILVHGYQSNGSIFDNMKDYLASKNFRVFALDYQSQMGVAASADELKSYLDKVKLELLSQGILVSKFDLVAHSMGGLVVRYYTTSAEYIKNNNVRKIIFVSVPQKGSIWAPIGSNYFDDQGIRDLAPDSDLIAKQLPSMINAGLNSTIQTGSIIGQYDEVVSAESASLHNWNIETEVFYVGESNLSIDSLVSGNIIQSPVHKAVLNNMKVFMKIEEMLNNELPYPAQLK